MITKNECLEFLNEFVSVGIPHATEPRNFFYSGVLLEVTDYYIKLKTRNGYKEIPYNELKEIRRGR